MSLFEEIREIVSKQLGLRPEEIRRESSFSNDLGTDSLDTIELVATLEEKFNIEIPDEDAEKMRTISDAVKYIGKKTKRTSTAEKK